MNSTKVLEAVMLKKSEEKGTAQKHGYQKGIYDYSGNILMAQVPVLKYSITIGELYGSSQFADRSS